jgi:hypothetical protein
MDIWEETSTKTGMKQWHKGLRPETVTASRKQESIQQDCQGNFRTRDHEMSIWDFQRVAKNEYQDIVEESAPSEMKEELASSFRVRAIDGKALTTLATVNLTDQ